MHVFNMRNGYERFVRAVLDSGTYDRSPRGLKTVELEDFTFVLDSVYDALPVGVGRDLNLRIAAAEAWQLIGAFSDPEWLIGIAPQFARYADEDRHGDRYFHGAYGDRIGDQLSDVTTKLTGDRDTRQAVITLWDPYSDSDTGKRDYPCTVALGFSIQRDRLNARVIMRSNDAWLGLPYDVFQFTQLQLTLCNALSVEPGTYTHTAWSLHLYETNIDAVSQLHKSLDITTFQPHGFGQFGEDIDAITDRCRELHYGDDTVPLTGSEKWYVDLN